MDKKILPLVSIIFTVIIWGLSFLSIKIVVAIIAPMTLALIRFFIATILLFGIVLFKKENIKIAIKDIPIMVICGFVGITIYFYFENNGIKNLKASSASLIIATIPIFTIILDSIIYKSRITFLKVISILISFMGVYLLVIKASDSGINNPKGYVMMFLAVLSWVIYSIIIKPLFDKYSRLVIVFYHTLFGTILFIPFSIFEKTNWNLIDINIILNLLYLGVFCSALAYLTYIYALEKLGISVSSLYLNIIPVVAVIASILILKESLSFIQMIGGIFIIISVYILELEDKIKNKYILNEK